MRYAILPYYGSCKTIYWLIGYPSMRSTNFQYLRLYHSRSIATFWSKILNARFLPCEKSLI